ncbi:hypothetical protein HDV05_001461, partial [Chytridiales sp. JEL 0842]
PFVEDGWGTFVMLDISGYSALTSSLNSLGKISSEVITNTVSTYLDQIIRLIVKSDGDIIKFLGDAIIVLFRLKEGEGESASIERATACCMNILLKYSLIDINLDRAIEDNRRLSVGGDHSYSSGNAPNRRGSVVANVNDNSGFEGVSKNLQLTIHVAVTGGPVSHTIFGNIDNRLDYVAYGKCLETLGEVLDSAKGGELGVDTELLKYSSHLKRVLPPLAAREGPGYVIIGRDALQELLKGMPLSQSATRTRSIRGGKDNIDVAVMSLLEEDEDDNLSFQTSGTTQIPNAISEHGVGDDDELLPLESKKPTLTAEGASLLEKFVNQSLARKLKTADEISRRATVNHGRRLSTSGAKTNLIAAEFRNVTIVFVKLKAQFSPSLAQLCLSKFAEILKKWEGVFQQYSVDDKVGDLS